MPRAVRPSAEQGSPTAPRNRANIRGDSSWYQSPKLWIPLVGTLSLGLTALALSGHSFANAPEQSTSEINTIPTSDETGTDAHDSQYGTEQQLKMPRVISAYDDSFVLRASGGTCEVSGTLEISGDGGRTWLSVSPEAQPNVAGIVSVTAARPSQAHIVGLHKDSCEPVRVDSVSGGVSWQTSNTAPMSYFDPHTPDIYVFGSEDIELPCNAIRAIDNGSSIAASCADGQLIMSKDSGDSWKTLATAHQVQDLTFSGSKIVAISTDTESCSGVIATTITAQGKATKGACHHVSSAQESLQVAATATAKKLYVWAADQILTSTDLGKSWN